MSGLRVSRSAAEFSKPIAARQSFASSACLARAYSGSIPASSSSPGAARTAKAQTSASASARARITKRALLRCQVLLHLPQLGAVAVGAARQFRELAEIALGLLRLARAFGRLGRAVVAA